MKKRKIIQMIQRTWVDLEGYDHTGVYGLDNYGEVYFMGSERWEKVNLEPLEQHEDYDYILPENNESIDSSL